MSVTRTRTCWLEEDNQSRRGYGLSQLHKLLHDLERQRLAALVLQRLLEEGHPIDCQTEDVSVKSRIC